MKFCELYHNGDPHPSNHDPGDKATNSKLWRKQAELAAYTLNKKAIYLGFGVNYANLYPTLVKDGEDIDIPFED